MFAPSCHGSAPGGKESFSAKEEGGGIDVYRHPFGTQQILDFRHVWRFHKTVLGPHPDKALAEIFNDGLDAVELMKWKELLDILESAMDRIEHAARVVGSTAMKNS